MTDHRWLTLARTISSWPKSEGGYVVTLKDKILIGTGVQHEAAQFCQGASLYYYPSRGSSLWADDHGLEEVARLIIPRGHIELDVSLDVEIEEVEL